MRVLFFVLLIGATSVMLILHERFGREGDTWAKIAAFFSALVAVIQLPVIVSDLMRWLEPTSGLTPQGQIEAENHKRMIENEARRNGGS
jgi:hypothetical protein